MDADSVAWLAALRGAGRAREDGLARLHGMLRRVAIREMHRRAAGTAIGGPEADDLALQAAGDALLAITAKLDTFRGESRFTTWAYRFVVLEVSSKLGRHYWRRPDVRLDVEDWGRLPDRLGADPPGRAERNEMIQAIRAAVDESLTEHQRDLFVAIVVNGVPLDAVVARTGSTRGAIYKAIFDARRKIRRWLVAKGYLDDVGSGSGSQQHGEVERA
jgi:RNA polymerase sigma-70 factor (ECF subfamily)